MSRDVLIAIGGGLLSAVAAVAFLGGSAFSLLFGYFAMVPLMLVGLGLGPRAVTIAVGAGICATGIFGGIVHAGVFALVQALPALVVTWLSISRVPQSDGLAADEDKPTVQSWSSPGAALSVLALLGGFFIAVAAISAGDGGLRTQIDNNLGEAIGLMMPTLSDPARELLVARLSAFFPGAIGASWLMMAVINSAVGQGVLVRANKNLRPTPAYVAFDLPQWTTWPLIGAAAVALAGGSVGADGLAYAAYNIAMVTAIPYFFMGLAVIHSLARRLAQTKAILFGLYVVLVVQIWAAIVVIGVGIAEQWVGLRDRKNDDDDDGQQPMD